MARPRSDIKERAVAAARERFLADGVDGTSLRAIARDAGTSIGMLYYYFPTKDDLFLGVVEQVYSRLLDDLSQILESEHDPEKRLEAVFRRMGGVSQRELEVIRLVVREALVSSERRDQLVERFLRGHVPLILGTLEEGVQAGRLRDDVPLPVLMMCALAMGVVPQLVRRQIGERGPLASAPEGNELTALLSKVLLEGMRRP